VIRRDCETGDGVVEYDLSFPSLRAFVSEFAGYLSHDGLFVPADPPDAPSTVVRFRVMLPEAFSLVEGTGVVSWVRQRGDAPHLAPGMALRFVSMRQQSQELIDQLVSTHVGEGGTPFDLERDVQLDQFVAASAGNSPATTGPPGEPPSAVTESSPAPVAPSPTKAVDKEPERVQFQVRGEAAEEASAPAVSEPEPPSPPLPHEAAGGVEEPPVAATVAEAPDVTAAAPDRPAAEEAASDLEMELELELDTDETVAVAEEPAQLVAEPPDEPDVTPDMPPLELDLDTDVDFEPAAEPVAFEPPAAAEPKSVDAGVPTLEDVGLELPDPELPGRDDRPRDEPVSSVDRVPGSPEPVAVAEPAPDEASESPQVEVAHEALESPGAVEALATAGARSREVTENDGGVAVEPDHRPGVAEEQPPVPAATEPSPEVPIAPVKMGSGPGSPDPEVDVEPETPERPRQAAAPEFSFTVGEDDGSADDTPRIEQGTEFNVSLFEAELEPEPTPLAVGAGLAPDVTIVPSDDETAGAARPGRRGLAVLVAVLVVAVAAGAYLYRGPLIRAVGQRMEMVRSAIAGDSGPGAPTTDMAEAPTTDVAAEPTTDVEGGGDSGSEAAGRETGGPDTDPSAVDASGTSPQAQEPEVQSSAPAAGADPGAGGAASATAIVDISASRVGQSTVVAIRANGPLAERQVSVFPMDSPPRVLVRIRGILEKYSEHEIPISMPQLRSIRVGLHPEFDPPALYVVLDRATPDVVVSDHGIDGEFLTLTLEGY
jgi:uncharacterized protein (TIGR02266 family)